MYKKIILGLSILLSVLSTQAQNNAIFFGGDGDGWSTAGYQQIADENISLGGEDDGFSSAGYQQIADENISLGGEDDGFSKSGYQQIADENISIGGEGDGWASVIYPVGPLPVELLTFTGKEVNNTHLLNWTTVMEFNSSHFVIEHSPNAITFSELGKRDAGGNSSERRNYSFQNMHPVLGNNFYRLNMVDIDGKSKYSNTILLKLLKDNTSIMVFPNPTASMLNIELNGINAGAQLQIQVLDASGKVVKSDNLTFSNQQYSIDVSSYSNGMYFLKIKGNTINEIVKFSISK